MTTLTSIRTSERDPRPRPPLRWLLTAADRLRAAGSRAGARGQLGTGYDARRDGYLSAQDRVGIPRVY